MHLSFLRIASQPELKLEQRVMAFLKSQALGKKQISEALGQINISGQLNKVIRLLLDGEYIEPTIPEKPQSRLQKYRLTTSGKMLVDIIKSKK
jgi:ATP-dependent DNA helicase RecG